MQAANAEINKIRRLQIELNDTAASLQNEKAAIETELTEFDKQYRENDHQLAKIAAPVVSSKRTSFNQLVAKRAEVIAALEKIKRLDRLVQQRAELEADEGEAGSTVGTRTKILKMTLDKFSQTVERILTEWHYPNANRVFFDEVKKDFQIGGKERGSSGKGLRAITHAAVSVALLEFCRENYLPHPGFFVLDSPLLAYWKPEGQEDDLRGTDLKEMFYRHLLDLQTDNQVIIVENEHPFDFVFAEGNVEVFTKNLNQGRHGFFPQGD